MRSPSWSDFAATGLAGSPRIVSRTRPPAPRSGRGRMAAHARRKDRPGVTQRLAAVHRALRDLGHPVPLHPRRRTRAAAAGAGLPAHGAGGAPAAAVRAARRRAARVLRSWPWVLLYTALELCVPWLLLAHAEERISSSLAGPADRDGAAHRRRGVPRVRGGRPLRRAPAHRALRRVRRRRRPGRPRPLAQRRARHRRDASSSRSATRSGPSSSAASSPTCRRSASSRRRSW